MKSWELIFVLLKEYHGKDQLQEHDTEIAIRLGSIEAVSDGKAGGSIVYTDRRVFFVKENRGKVFELMKKAIELSQT